MTSVAITSFKCRLSDEQGILAEKVVPKDELPSLVLADETVGWETFFDLPSKMPGKSTWRFVLEVEYEGPEPSPSPQLPDDSPTSKHQTDLLQLFETGEDADVVFKVKGETIPAHMLILAARARYFDRMFKSGMKECVSKEVIVPDTEPQVFRAMLQFIYSGLPPKKLEEIALDLLVVADKYGLCDLKKICELRACCILDENDVVEALILAERHNCDLLGLRALSVFHENIDNLNASSYELLKTEPDLLLSMLYHFTFTSRFERT